MRPQELVDELELRYLQAVHYLAGGKAKVAVSLREVQEDVGCTAEEAMRFCNFWSHCGSLERAARNQIALTRIGLAQAEYLAEVAE